MAEREAFRMAVQDCLEEDYDLDRPIAQSICFVASPRLDVLCETTPLVLVEEAAEEVYTDPKFWRHL